MITFVILMAIAIIVAIIAAFILLTCGSVGCVIFSDLIEGDIKKKWRGFNKPFLFLF